MNTYPDAHILLGTIPFAWTWDDVLMCFTLAGNDTPHERRSRATASKVDEERGAKVATGIGVGRGQRRDR
jgi:hypothetical protein